MKHWFKDGGFRAVLRNAGYLGSGRLVGAGLGLIALVCAGRGLDPAVFGVLMLVHTYAQTAGALVKFQSWQVILRYGAPALLRDDGKTAEDSIRLAFGLDIASGIVGMVAAMAVLPFIAGAFGIDRGHLALAILYCTLVPTMASATSTGVLRLLDRFDLIASQQVATPLLRATGAAIAFFGHLGFPGFVVAWYVADIVGDLILWALAVRELKRRDMLRALRPGLMRTARRLPKSWGFVWTTNIAISLDAAWGPVSNLVVGGVLGPVAAGLYKIASTLLDPASEQPWRLGLRTGALAGVMGLAVVLLILAGGKPLIGFAFGHKYLAAYPLLNLMMFALMISMASFPLQSLLYMVHRQHVALVAQSAATVVYLGTLAVLAHLFGLRGAGLAYVIGNAALALFMLGPVLTSYRHRDRYAIGV